MHTCACALNVLIDLCVYKCVQFDGVAFGLVSAHTRQQRVILVFMLSVGVDLHFPLSEAILLSL